VAVEGAEVGDDAFAIVESSAVVALADAVDVGLVGGADGVAEATDFLEARLAETLIRVAVVVVPRRTVGADAPDPHVLRIADTLLGDGAIELVDAQAGDNIAGLSIGIVGLARETLGTGTLDDVVSLGAVTLATIEVVDLVGTALNAADTLVDVVDLAGRALGAEVVDQVESWLADATTGDPVLIDVADGSADTVAALARHLMVAVDTVATLEILVVDLSVGVTLRADAADEVVGGQATAGTDGGVPDLVGLATGTADAVGGVVGLGGRADTTAVADKVVSGLALANSIDPLLVRIAGSDAKAEVQEVPLIADTLLGD
jgi:hypothetical protein